MILKNRDFIPLSPSSFRARILKSGETLAQLAEMSDNEILKFPTLGRKSLRMIREALPPAAIRLRTMCEAMAYHADAAAEFMGGDSVTEAYEFARIEMVKYVRDFHGVQLGRLPVRTIDGTQYANAQGGIQNWLSPDTMLAEAEADVVAAIIAKRNDDVDLDNRWQATTWRPQEC